MKFKEKGVVYKTSRLCYWYNYVLIGIVLSIIILILPYLNFQNILHFVLFFGLLMIASGLSEEAEWERIFRKYIVTNNEIIKLDGFIRKKRIAMPFQSVADIRVSKGAMGRIFDFGHVSVVGFKDEILMKGLRNPELIQRIIQNKINMQRQGLIKTLKQK